MMQIRVLETSEPLDLNIVRDTHHKIAEFRKISKDMSVDSPARPIIQNKLSELRKQLENFTTMVYKVQVSNRRFNYYEIFTERPKTEDILNAKNEFKKRVKSSRAVAKTMNVQNKDVIGFRYSTIGGVMQTPGTIKFLQDNTDPINRVRAVKKPVHNSKDKYVGVEIELLAKCNHESLEHAIIRAGLAGRVKVGRDSSIAREDASDYPHELTVMCKQEQLKETFNKLCEVLRIPYISAYVNNSCGLHVHIDCRNRDPKVVYKNLVHAIPIMTSMVPADRISGEASTRYCQRNKTASYDEASQEGNRYQIVNAMAFQKYNTIEVRLHSGTTNAAKIVNWATLLVAIADATNITGMVNSIHELDKLLSLPSKLVAYVERRTELFSKKQIKDTREDHFDTKSNFEMAV